MRKVIVFLLAILAIGVVGTSSVSAQEEVVLKEATCYNPVTQTYRRCYLGIPVEQARYNDSRNYNRESTYRDNNRSGCDSQYYNCDPVYQRRESNNYHRQNNQPACDSRYYNCSPRQRSNDYDSEENNRSRTVRHDVRVDTGNGYYRRPSASYRLIIEEKTRYEKKVIIKN